MSQWSNCQDYVNGGDGEPTSEGGESIAPPKTVRCVILKEFGDGTRKLGSGDCGQPTPQPPKRPVVCDSTVDSIRLKNHLEWKKQKEMEYLRKKEKERAEEQRRKEQLLREEKEKRRKEKQREERIKEWQRQKAREKEQRKREEIVLKALEEEIKGVSQNLDKEKLIHEWIQIKNKQKQAEAERKAEMLKKEEETRALRRTLAEINYRQWKERTKSRRIVLPKNGYQIFGPKPVPVVKEDWNHNFASEHVETGASARTISMTSIRGSRTDCKNSPSSCQLKTSRSKSSVANAERGPFRELATPRTDCAQRWKSVENFITRQGEEAFAGREREKAADRDACVPNGLPKLLNVSAMDMLPSKSKLDVYLQPSEDEPCPDDDLTSYLHRLSDVNAKLLIDLNEKLFTEERKQQAECRRCRSCDKPELRVSIGRSPSATDGKKAPKAEGKTCKKGKKAEPGAPAEGAFCQRKPRAGPSNQSRPSRTSNRKH